MYSHPALSQQYPDDQDAALEVSKLYSYMSEMVMVYIGCARIILVVFNNCMCSPYYTLHVQWNLHPAWSQILLYNRSEPGKSGQLYNQDALAWFLRCPDYTGSTVHL